MTELRRIEAEECGERRKHDDRERSIEGDEGDGRAGVFLVRTAGRGHRPDRGDSADRESGRHQHGLVTRQPKKPSDQPGDHKARDHERDDGEDREPAESGNVAEAELGSEHDDTDPQQSFGGDREAGSQRSVEGGAEGRNTADEYSEDEGCRQPRQPGEQRVEAEAAAGTNRGENKPGEPAGAAGLHTRFFAGLLSVPMPSIMMSILWPSTKPPSPAGVPVMITSPGSRVQTSETNSMISGILWIMSLVLP